MKGYRTIISNMLMFGASILAVYGVDIPPELIQEVVTGLVGIITAVNLILRNITTSPIGKKE